MRRRRLGTWWDRLSTHLVVSHVVVAGVVLGLALGISGIAFRQYLVRSQISGLVTRGTEISRVMQGYYSGSLYGPEATYLIRVLQRTLKDRVYVLNDVGTLLFEAGSREVPAAPWSRSQLLQVLVKGQVVKGIAESPKSGPEAVVGIPVTGPGQVYGGVFLESPLSISNQTANSLTLLLLLAELLAIGLVGVLAYGLSRRLSKPLESLRQTVAKMQGAAAVRAVPEGPQEVKELAHEFNQLADRIDLQVQQLTRESEIREALLGHVAHDLRTPLTSIRGFLEAIRDHVVEGPEMDRAVEIAFMETMRVKRLVDRLLAATRIRSGIGPLGPVAVTQWIGTTLDRMEPLIQQTGHEIDWECQDQAMVAGVLDHLVEALMNVLDNAMKWSPPGAPIRIRSMARQDRVQIMVDDRGPGIPADLLPHVLERFVTGDRARSDSNGLGLAIVQEVMEQHRGTVRLENLQAGGTRVILDLPLWVDDGEESRGIGDGQTTGTP